MRSLALVCLAAAAACGDGGLALAIRAPDVPAGVDRVEIVLASPDVTTAEGQLAGGAVLYYRQRSTTGELAPIPKLDGYVVRLEPSGGSDELYVPFAIAYAGEAAVAAGFVSDGAPAPRPLALAVPGGSRVEATVDLVALAPADPALGVASGQIELVRCNGARSGIAWQPPDGPQLRIVLPDPEEAGKLDASGRPLDLDCDGDRADGGDCDDLRARIGPGAAEACDGVDTNCDGADYALVPCDPPDADCPGSTDGVRACHDAAGAPQSECRGLPACRCRPGSTAQCSRCTLQIEGTASPVKVCAPAVGKLLLPACTQLSPCLVEVVRQADSDGWDIAIASGPRLDFKSNALVLNGELVLRVKPADAEQDAAPGASVGAVHLVVATMVNTFTVLGIDLELGSGRLDGCSSLPTQEGLFPMVCAL